MLKEASFILNMLVIGFKNQWHCFSNALSEQKRRSVYDWVVVCTLVETEGEGRRERGGARGLERMYAKYGTYLHLKKLGKVK